jgi:hypothetical protein
MKEKDIYLKNRGHELVGLEGFESPYFLILSHHSINWIMRVRNY